MIFVDEVIDNQIAFSDASAYLLYDVIKDNMLSNDSKPLIVSFKNIDMVIENFLYNSIVKLYNDMDRCHWDKLDKMELIGLHDYDIFNMQQSINVIRKRKN